MTACRRCKRPLRNPASIKAGMGPTCAAKAGVNRDGSTGEPTYYPSGSVPQTWLDFAVNVPGESYVAFVHPTQRSETAPVMAAMAAHVRVDDDGNVHGRYLDPRLDLVKHSPTGYQYGYGGSGPSQLAWAILHDHLSPHGNVGGFVARNNYMDFKREFLGRVSPPQPLVIPVRDVEEWLAKQEVRVEARPA